MELDLSPNNRFTCFTLSVVEPIGAELARGNRTSVKLFASRENFRNAKGVKLYLTFGRILSLAVSLLECKQALRALQWFPALSGRFPPLSCVFALRVPMKYSRVKSFARATLFVSPIETKLLLKQRKAKFSSTWISWSLHCFFFYHKLMFESQRATTLELSWFLSTGQNIIFLPVLYFASKVNSSSSQRFWVVCCVFVGS